MLHNIAPGLGTERGGDEQGTCASGFMDAAKLTCPGAPRAPRGRHLQWTWNLLSALCRPGRVQSTRENLEGTALDYLFVLVVFVPHTHTLVGAG
jgi:hypothetical protein